LKRRVISFVAVFVGHFHQLSSYREAETFGIGWDEEKREKENLM